MKRTFERMNNSDIPTSTDNGQSRGLNTSTPNIPRIVTEECMPGILISFDFKNGLSIRIGAALPVSSTMFWSEAMIRQSSRTASEPPPVQQPSVQTTTPQPSVETMSVKPSVQPTTPQPLYPFVVRNAEKQ